MSYAQDIAAQFRRQDFVEEVHVITTLGPTNLPGVRRQAEIEGSYRPWTGWQDHVRDWEQSYESPLRHKNHPCFVDPIFIHRPTPASEDRP